MQLDDGLSIMQVKSLLSPSHRLMTSAVLCLPIQRVTDDTINAFRHAVVNAHPCKQKENSTIKALLDWVLDGSEINHQQ
jgi:hypothetical protein